MTTISSNLQAVRERLEGSARDCGRDPQGVALLAVSKTWPPQAIREAFAAGQRSFGENYVQEGVDKVRALQDLPIEWHFIGPLQSNKTRLVAEHFEWVHSVDRLKLAERLSAQRPAGRGALNVCLQVNVSGEASKSGVRPDEVFALATAIAGLPGLRLRGLMCIPEADADERGLRGRFALLRGLRDRLATEQGIMLDTLSMGMSDDLELAIAEGSTLVRVGSAIFGARASRQTGEKS